MDNIDIMELSYFSFWLINSWHKDMATEFDEKQKFSAEVKLLFPRRNRVSSTFPTVNSVSVLFDRKLFNWNKMIVWWKIWNIQIKLIHFFLDQDQWLIKNAIFLAKQLQFWEEVSLFYEKLKFANAVSNVHDDDYW